MIFIFFLDVPVYYSKVYCTVYYIINIYNTF